MGQEGRPRTREAKEFFVTRAGNFVGRHWFAALTTAGFLWVGLPWLAPVLMKLGWEGPAQIIYFMYSFQCHQLPQRSFFLFGESAMYSLDQLPLTAAGVDNLAELRQFIGNPEMGYKVAWSDRMVSAYSSIPIAAVVVRALRERMAPLPWWGFVLCSLPMFLDGSTHFVSDLAGLGRGFRYTNDWLAQLTSHALPASFYAGNKLGSFNSWMRLITGVLFGFGLMAFALPPVQSSLAASQEEERPTLRTSA